MGFYGNLLLNESKISIVNNEGNIYETNFKLDGVKLRFISYNGNDIDSKSNEIQNSFSLLKMKYKSIIEESFKDLLRYCEEWEMDCKNSKDLIKMTKLSHVKYRKMDDSNRYEYVIWFNDGKSKNMNFFGGHSFVVTVKIDTKNKSFEITNSTLAG